MLLINTLRHYTILSVNTWKLLFKRSESGRKYSQQPNSDISVKNGLCAWCLSYKTIIQLKKMFYTYSISFKCHSPILYSHIYQNAIKISLHVASYKTYSTCNYVQYTIHLIKINGMLFYVFVALYFNVISEHSLLTKVYGKADACYACYSFINLMFTLIDYIIPPSHPRA